MKKIAISTVFLSLCCSILACQPKEQKTPALSQTEKNINMDSTQLKITVNGQSFVATLIDNTSTQAFIKQLPFEKLPCENSKSGLIQAGDLMVWDASQRSIVLFYKTFQSPYKYVRIAYINEPEKLAEVLGSDNVKVKFELIKPKQNGK